MSVTTVPGHTAWTGETGPAQTWLQPVKQMRTGKKKQKQKNAEGTEWRKEVQTADLSEST